MQRIYNTLLILTVAFCSATLTYLLVGIILIQSGWNPLLTDLRFLQILLVVFATVGLGGAFLAVRIEQLLYSGSTRRFDVQEALQKHVLSRYIIAFVLAEIPSILGLVYYLLSGAFLYLVVFCLISGISLFLLRPSLSGLMELERRAGSAS